LLREVRPGRRGQRGRRGLVFAVGVLGTLGAGCSLLYDLSTEQCSSDADCDIFGAGYTCNAAQVCAAPQVGVDQGGSGGDGGSAGSTSGSSGDSGSAGTSGTSGASGTAGTASVECTTNSECIEDNGGRPFVCRNNTCLDLTSDDCPFVIAGANGSLDNLLSPNPMIIGAYTFIPDDGAVTASPPTANYQMALDEFTTNAPGGGFDNGQRKLVMVACKGNTSSFTASIDHLIDVVQVPAVIAPIPASDLVAMFEAKKTSGVFFMSPFDADSSLTTLDDDTLVWNILGSGAKLAPSYVPLLQRTEDYLRTTLPAPVPTNIKVALLDDETRFQKDISSELIGVTTPLAFNSRAFNLNRDTDDCGAGSEPCFLQLEIPSTPDANNTQRYADAVQALLDFEPNVIISITSVAFVTEVMDTVELNWVDPAPRPFYLMGPYIGGRPELSDVVVDDNANCGSSACIGERVLGINFESARDPTVVDYYRNAFDTKFSGVYDNFYENFYDAAWYTIYALAAAGDVPELTGADVANGMRKIIQTQSSPTRHFQLGLSDVSEVFYALRNTTGIQLDGTMGTPDFNLITGARDTLGSAFCVGATGDFMFDVLRYDATGPAMTGNITSTCVPAGF